MNFIKKIAKFMYGRYGVDDLYKFLFKCFFFLTLINLIFHNTILFYIELLIFVIMMYRVLSKNISKRYKENIRFLSIKKKALKPFSNIKRNYRDRKQYVYKKCHNCKTTLRLPLPSRRGINHVKCPECKKRLTLFSLRKEKIEIIRTKRKEVRNV